MDMFIFILIVGALLTADVHDHLKAKPIELIDALKWSAVYVGASLIFALYLLGSRGSESATLFLAGYALEKMLAFDNLFVFALIFSYFKIPEKDQHRALHWGIAGAIVFRLIFVMVGVTFMAAFGGFAELVLAGVIIYTMYVMYMADGEEVDNYDDKWFVKLTRKVYPAASLTVVAIVAIEVSDVLFAFDSVPAILAVTKEPFLVYTSMILAVLGLRSMYFVIAALKQFLVYMDQTVMVVLGFIAMKMIFSGAFDMHMAPSTSLITIMAILIGGVTLSAVKGEKNEG